MLLTAMQQLNVEVSRLESVRTTVKDLVQDEKERAGTNATQRELLQGALDNLDLALVELANQVSVTKVHFAGMLARLRGDVRNVTLPSVDMATIGESLLAQVTEKQADLLLHGNEITTLL